MRRYQELFDYVLYDDLNDMLSKLRVDMTPEKVNSVLSKQSVLNMLNTRYIIYNNDAPPMVNNSALGNAWFVNDYYLVNDANDEIKALANFNPANQAIIDRRFENHLAGLKIRQLADNDTSALPSGRSAKIYLTSYKPNHLQYISAANSEQLAVFSEIYYDKGWNAYTDGKLTPHFRVNYVLRAMRIPPGNHKIEFRFEPESYFIGEKVSLLSSVLIILLILGSIVNELIKLK
jgi:hypothetical protein